MLPSSHNSQRLRPLNPPAGTSEIADEIRARRGPARGITPLDGALLHAPELARGWNNLLGAVRTKTSLPGDVRELIVNSRLVQGSKRLLTLDVRRSCG